MKESREKLVVGNVKLIYCSYATASRKESFRRRVYSLLDGDTDIALVHYLDENPASPGTPYLTADAPRATLPFTPLTPFSPTPLSPTIDSKSENALHPSSFHTIDSTQPSSPFLQASHVPPPSPSYPVLAHIAEYSPDWDYLEGGAKMLIISPFFHPAEAPLSYFCAFGDALVPAFLIQPGVLRCVVPPSRQTASVSLHVLLGRNVVSDTVQFEYRVRADALPTLDTNAEPLGMHGT